MNHSTITSSPRQNPSQLLWSGGWQNICDLSVPSRSSAPSTNHKKPQIRRRMGQLAFFVSEEPHVGHTHQVLVSPERFRADKSSLRQDGEGCVCCAIAIDIDELAPIGERLTAPHSDSGSVVGHAPHWDSAAHWLGFAFAGTFAGLGLTAAYRNITGSSRNERELKAAIDTLQKHIEHQEDPATVTRQKASKRGLKYSLFDTQWNKAVPGYVNGAASTLVLSTSVWSHPFALPLVHLYGLLQSMRAIYDTWRSWNWILSEASPDSGLSRGHRKMNRVTRRKRAFYPSLVLGFGALSAGAALSFLSIPALGLMAGVGPIVLGVALLFGGALFTGFANNLWTNRFRPRNSYIGIDRDKADEQDYVLQVGDCQALKKALKQKLKSHFYNRTTAKMSFTLTKLFWQTAAILPGMSRKAMMAKHKTSKRMLQFIDNNLEHPPLEETKQLVSELKALIPTSRLIPQARPKQAGTTWSELCFDLAELNMMDAVLKNFFLEFYQAQAEDLKPAECSCCNQSTTALEQELQMIKGFHKGGDAWIFDPIRFEQQARSEHKDNMLNAIRFTLLFTEPEHLQYKQYGAEAAYWNLVHTRRKIGI